MITIAWDVDDVLNDLMRRWLEDAWKPGHPSCKVEFRQITENPPERIIGCSRQEYSLSLDAYRLSKGYPGLEPDAEVLAWFEKNGFKARHIALSSVPLKACHVSASWVMKYFGKWIRSFNFVPSFRQEEDTPVYGRNKADYLKWFGKADVLVEDSGENIIQAEALGIRGILIGKPWNGGDCAANAALGKLDELL